VNGDLLALHFLSADVGYVSGNAGTLAKTLDGGAHWEVLTGPSRYDPVYAVRAVDEKVAYATGYAGVLVKTVDGGQTWSREATLTNSTLRSLFIVDAGTVFAAGGNGVILRSPDPATFLRAPETRSFVGPQVWSGRLYLSLSEAAKVAGSLYGLDGRRVSRSVSGAGAIQPKAQKRRQNQNGAE
jgi:hypothetical protein